MKIKKILCAAFAGALLLSSCKVNLTPSSIDYSKDAELTKATNNGNGLNTYNGGTVTGYSNSLVAGKKGCNAKIVITSRARLNHDSIVQALSFYSLSNNTENSSFYPVRASTALAYDADALNINENIANKKVTTEVDYYLDLTDVTCNKIAYVLDAEKLTYTTGSSVLNANGNETPGEENDSYVGYLSVDNSSVSSPVTIENTVAEDFCPKFSYPVYFEWEKDYAGNYTGKAVITANAPVFNGNYIESADDVNKIYSLNVCRPGESSYKNEQLSFTYDADKHTFNAFSVQYPEGTKVILVTKHSNDIKTDLTKAIYGHTAQFSYYSTSYNTYSDTYETGCVALDTETIVALTEFTTVVNGNAEEAQNNLLYVEKQFTYETVDIKGGTQWFVTINPDYDDVAEAFDLTDGFLVTNSSYIAIPCTVSIIEKTEGGKATKIKISANNEKLDGRMLNLWVNKGLSLVKNNVNEKQIFFGCALDSTKAAASGYVQLASDEIEGLNGSASTYYNLSGYENGGGVQLSWYLEAGKGKTVYIYRGATFVGSSAGSQFFDATVSSGTSYTYYLYDSAGNTISNSCYISVPPKTNGACYTVSISDSSLMNYGYLYITVSHISGTDYYSFKLYREDVTSSLSSSNNYYDYNLESGKTYVYYVADADGKIISDKVSYKIPNPVFDIYVPPVTKETTNSRVYWTQKAGLTYSYDDVYLDIEGSSYYTSYSYNYDNNTYNGYYGKWYYVTNVNFEAGETYKILLKDFDGNVLADEYIVTVPKVYYDLNKSFPDGSFDKLEIDLKVSSGTRTACKLWKDGKVLAELTDSQSYYIDEHAGDNPGKTSYYYVTDAANDTIVYSDYMAYLPPALIEIPVYVYEVGDITPSETFNITIHEYSSDYASIGFSEVWKELAKKNEKYTSTVYNIKADKDFGKTIPSSALKDGVEIYLANINAYAIRAELPVDKDSHALSNDVADFFVAENLNSGTDYWYKFKTEPGKLYTIQFYNSQTADKFESFKGANSYNFGSVYLYLYNINEDKTHSSSHMIYSNSNTNYTFVADKEEYLIKLDTYSGDVASCVRIVENLEENILTLNMPAYNGSEAKKYLIPIGYYARYNHVYNYWMYNWQSSWTDIKDFLIKEYGLDDWILNGPFTFYTDEACTTFINNGSEYVKPGNIYAKENIIPLKTKSVSSYDDFTKIKYEDCNSSEVYMTLNLESEKTYVFEYLGTKNKAAYGFDYDGDTFIQNNGYSIYVYDEINDSLKYEGSPFDNYGCKTMFTARDEIYFLRVSGLSSDACAAVNVYELVPDECLTFTLMNSDESVTYKTLYFLPAEVYSSLEPLPGNSKNCIAYYNNSGSLTSKNISWERIIGTQTGDSAVGTSDLLESIRTSEYGYTFYFHNELGEWTNKLTEVANGFNAGSEFKAVERTSAE